MWILVSQVLRRAAERKGGDEGSLKMVVLGRKYFSASFELNLGFFKKSQVMWMVMFQIDCVGVGLATRLIRPQAVGSTPFCRWLLGPFSECSGIIRKQKPPSSESVDRVMH